MPVNPTYPGVYVEEIPSGVRTITGVSTSVAAFVGIARSGPISVPERVLSFADYERRFGGLDQISELSYAVRQFFNNGGSEAWVVRLAKTATPAVLELGNANDLHVLTLTALNQGFDGNNIRVAVDPREHSSDFNLTLDYRAPGRQPTVEQFENLSMNSSHPRYVVNQLSEKSALVFAERPGNVALPGSTERGTLDSGELPDATGLIDEQHNQFRISVNGLPAITVGLTSPNPPNGLIVLAEQIQSQVRVEGEQLPDTNAEKISLTGFVCAVDSSGTKLVMTSGKGGESSAIRVLPGGSKNIARRLKLGPENGGKSKDAIESIRPVLELEWGALFSANLPNTNQQLPDPDQKNQFRLVLDGAAAATIVLAAGALTGNNLSEKKSDIAARIEVAVRAARANDAFGNFTCQYDSGNDKLVLRCGTRGKGSSVMIFPAIEKDVAADLRLLTELGAVSEPVNSEPMLQNGFEDNDFNLDDYNIFIGSQASREGIYALEAIEIFNLLCLPGVSNPAILSDAASYCHKRRAFLIADSPTGLAPDNLLTELADYPRSNYAAVYYPWIKIPDPLKNGRLRLTPPSGTVAGIYARTDSQRGVWKAPAGIESNLTGVLDLEYKLTDGENGFLNPKGVNCLREFPASGRVIWGARTRRGEDGLSDEYKYIPVRRLALYIEESLYRGTQWVVFEPNDEPLWSQVRLNIGGFMRTLFRQGAFQGTTPREAYFVKCDRETTTQVDINNGIVNIVVGFAPLKPAEFVIINIQQITGDIPQ